MYWNILIHVILMLQTKCFQHKSFELLSIFSFCSNACLIDCYPNYYLFPWSFHFSLYCPVIVFLNELTIQYKMHMYPHTRVFDIFTRCCFYYQQDNVHLPSSFKYVIDSLSMCTTKHCFICQIM